MIEHKGDVANRATGSTYKNKNTSNINSATIPKNKVALFITMYNKIYALEGSHDKAAKKIGIGNHFIYSAKAGRVELEQGKKILAAYNAIKPTVKN